MLGAKILAVIAACLIGLSEARGHKYSGYPAGKRTYSACSGVMLYTASFCPQIMGHRGSMAPPDCVCKNPNAMATMAGCYYILDRTGDKYLDVYIKNCKEYNVTLTKSQIEGAYENYTKHAVWPTEIEGFNLSKPVNVPVKLNSTFTHLYADAYDVFLGNYENSLYYGAGALGYWLAVFLIAAVVNWSKVLFPGVVAQFTGPISNVWRKYITLPAAIRRKKTNEQKLLYIFDLLVPSRLETLIIFLFACLLIGVCAGGIYYVDNDPIFSSKKMALLRYTADKTGIVVSCIMPLLILFAGRNNFLQWLTRWDFATFIAFHRWVARYVFIMVLIHACCFTATFVQYHDYAEEIAETYVIWGTIATVAGGIIMFQGMLFLRRAWYEIFLLIHIIMAALFIGGAWIHVDELGYVYFYYATVAVWVFDRAVRLGRIAVFGFPKAEVILLADETLKVVIPKPSYWKSIPGGHAFIHFLRPSCFWQSHPFTFTETSDNGSKIVLYCKVKGGVTHGLYQYLAKHPGRTTNIRVALEGPYGEPTAAKRYSTAVFVAGGNGIPGIYSEVYDLAKRSPDNSKQVLKLFWIVREYRSLYWFYEELLALKNTRIQATVFVTKPSSHAYIEDFNNRIPYIKADLASSSGPDGEIVETNYEIAEKDSYKKKEKDLSFDEDADEVDDKSKIIDIIKSELSHITFQEGRPSVEKMVEEEIRESNGSIAFVTCGHPVMVDDLRYAVAHNLDKSDGKRVEFYEQLQVWA